MRVIQIPSVVLQCKSPVVGPVKILCNDSVFVTNGKIQTDHAELKSGPKTNKKNIRRK